MDENGEQNRRLILNADQKLFKTRAISECEWMHRGSATKQIKRYQNVQNTTAIGMQHRRTMRFICTAHGQPKVNGEKKWICTKSMSEMHSYLCNWKSKRFQAEKKSIILSFNLQFTILYKVRWFFSAQRIYNWHHFQLWMCFVLGAREQRSNTILSSSPSVKRRNEKKNTENWLLRIEKNDDQKGKCKKDMERWKDVFPDKPLCAVCVCACDSIVSLVREIFDKIECYLFTV